MTMYAKIVADSISNEIRLTTLELSYPLMIHAQLMTHRMFSRNAQSNRAMPVDKMLKQVINEPAMPSKWGRNQAGMQDAGECDNEVSVPLNRLDYYYVDMSPEKAWQTAAEYAADISEEFRIAGYHKQVANRLTMPFQYIKVIVTATEWDNFFKLRLHDADPTMMELAGKMKEAMDDSVPVELEQGEYHTPYVSSKERTKIGLQSVFIKCSVARCARVSYNNHDNSNPDVEKDVALADRLLKDGHMSPFEHQATPMKSLERGFAYDGIGSWLAPGETHADKYNQVWSNNFRGWIQYRALV